MESQPNEIISYILSYLDNHKLTLARRVCPKWKFLIEKLLHQRIIPPLHVCIIDQDYYHMGHYYLIMNNVNSEYAFTENEYYYKLAWFVGNPYFYNLFLKFIEDRSSVNKYYFPYLDTGKYILERSAYMGHLIVIKYLVRNYIPIHENNEYAFISSAAYGHLKLVKYFINKGVDLRAYGNYALLQSAINNKLDIVKYFVSLGIKLNANDCEAFRCAASCGQLDVIKYFLDNGADIHANKDEAFLKSAEHGHIDVIKYLVENGANMLAMDYHDLDRIKKNNRDVWKYIVVERTLRCAPFES